MSLDRKRKEFIIGIFIAFLFLILFYKWQLATSSDYLNRADKSYEDENYDKALKDYKYAAAIDGDIDTFYLAKLKRAEIFYKHGRLNEAEKELQEALNKKKDNYRVYELLGDVFYSKREFDKAINYYNNAAKLNDEKDINIKTAKGFIAKGELGLAFDIFSSLYSKNSEDEEVLYYLGLLDFNKNVSSNGYFEKLEESNSEKYKDRIEKIEKVVGACNQSKNSDYKETVIADLYNKIDEPYLAINKIGFVIQNNQNYRDAWIVLGKSNFIIGDYKESLESFDKAFELDSHNTEICFWLGSAYEKIGNTSKAKEFFGKFEMLKS